MPQANQQKIGDGRELDIRLSDRCNPSLTSSFSNIGYMRSLPLPPGGETMKREPIFHAPKPYSLSVLIDSGAESNFIDISLAARDTAKPSPCSCTVRSASTRHYPCFRAALSLSLLGNHTERICFLHSRHRSPC